MPQRSSPHHRLRAAVFAPLGETGKAQRVEDRIVQGISSGVLVDGDRLPSETELASSFGVATVTAREALVGLRSRGLVATRRGRDGGTFVTVPSGDRHALVRRRLADMSRVELRDLSIHYSAIASTAAELAAGFADAEDVAALRRILEPGQASGHEVSDAGQEPSDAGREQSEAGGSTSSGGGESEAEAEAGAPVGSAPGRKVGDFLLELAALSQSARLTREYVRLHTDFGSLLALAHGDPEFDRAAARWCLEIVEALDRASPEAARHAVKEYTKAGLAWLITEHNELSGAARPASTSGRKA